MLTDAHIKDLEVKGYTVVKDIISLQECDEAIAEYRAWLSNFGEKFPKTFNSIIKDHNVGHMETTWRLRLKAKPLFSQLWKTEKLLTSFDAIAIGRPPEEGHEDFQDTRKYWLHADTTPSRIGLHAYQGALYLEEQTKNDWTFQVIEGSHKCMDEFFIKFPEKSRLSRQLGYYTKIEADDTEYFMSNKCRLSRVPVPKGGMVLWDSRLVHANARPLPNRKHKGRWRFVTFISMTPAIWANSADIDKRKEAYRLPTMTTHWSSQGVRLLDVNTTPGIPFPTAVPDIARTDDAMKLAGVIPYDFNDRKPNGDHNIPVWKILKDETTMSGIDLEKEYANGHI